MTDNPHYVTPEEAEKKMCMQLMNVKNGGANPVGCVGPDCMAWRWDKNAPIRYKGDGNPQPTEQAKGYCGMVRT